MIRDVGFLCWKQPSAWMERMSGVRWNNMVKKENKNFMDQVRKVSNQEELVSKQYEFMEANGSMFFSYKNILLKVAGGYTYEWFYVNTKKTYIVSDIYVTDYIYHTVDIKHGAQKYRVECIKDGKVLWHKDNVGSQIYVKGDKCYVFGVDQLWNNSLMLVDSQTGKLVTTLYEEADRRYNLSFVKGEGGALFLLRDNSGKEDLYIIEEKVNPIKSEATLYFPIGYYKKKLCYLENINNIWHARGFHLKPFVHEIEYFSLIKGIFILREHGLKCVYDLDFKRLFSFYGEIYTHPLKGSKFFIDFTGYGIQEFSFDKEISTCIVAYCKVERKFAISHDGTRVPYILSIPKCAIKGLIVAAYGAYGIPSDLSTRRWKPYIQDGWAICFALVRGGGDVDKEWAAQAKTYNKFKSCEDFEACIKAVQKSYNISPNHTCIYGRSAGGYLMGMAVARDSGLFKIVYTEVPYVDVLRTTTNSSLPLTALEFDEFGNPKNGIYEFQKILEMSPVDALKDVPDLHVLIRTSENDVQVYAYESYKWLDVLRGNKNDKEKFLYCTENKGHSIIGEEKYKNFSQDFYLLKSFRDNDK